jgi:hypothetical protein
MPDHATHEAVCLPVAVWRGVELPADRPRARTTCWDELSRGGPAQAEEGVGGSWTRDPREQVVDFVVRGRQ